MTVRSVIREDVHDVMHDVMGGNRTGDEINLLLEDGFSYLQEDGVSLILLEGATPP